MYKIRIRDVGGMNHLRPEINLQCCFAGYVLYPENIDLLGRNINIRLRQIGFSFSASVRSVSSIVRNPLELPGTARG